MKRRTKYTPAVTNVDECTRAETGVGAAIAAGSQALKGTCALLVTPAKIKNLHAHQHISAPYLPTKTLLPLGALITLNKLMRIILSPTRFIIPVINPAPREVLLL